MKQIADIAKIAKKAANVYKLKCKQTETADITCIF